MRQITKISLAVICVFLLTILFIYNTHQKKQIKGVSFNAGNLTERELLSLKNGIAFERSEKKANRIATYEGKLVESSRLAKDNDLLLFDGFQYDPTKSTKSFAAYDRKFADLSAKTISALQNISHRNYRIVQFKDKIGNGLSEKLSAMGLEVVGYVPNNAYIVAFDKDNDKSLSKISGIRAVSKFPKRAVLDQRLVSAIENDELDDTILIQVMAHRGENMDGWEQILLELGVNKIVYKRLESQPVMMLEVDSDVLPEILEALLTLPGVLNIRQFEVPVFLNYGSVWLLQSGDSEIKSTPIFDAGITGYGQIYAAIDSGLDTDACHFRYSAEASAQTFAQKSSAPSANISNADNKVIAYYVLTGSDAYDDSSGGYHGTMTTGCAVGDDYHTPSGRDDAGIDRSDGMAPAAKIVFQDAGSKQGMLYGLSFESQYNLSRQAYDSGARVHNDSYGLEGSSISYDQDSSLLDTFCWEKNDYTIFFAAGNSGPGERTLGGEGSTAKNTICVGASMPAWLDGGVDLVSFSSRGPTADGRLKPDIVAPGLVESATESNGLAVPGSTNVYGEQTVVSRTDPPNNQCSVSVTAGTSFASPTAAGMGLLVRQYFEDGFYPTGIRNEEDGFNPTSALVRAVIINSGRPLEGDVVGFNYHGEIVSVGEIDPIPSTHQGWGRITLDDALYLRGDSRDLVVFDDISGYDDGVLQTGDEAEYEVYVKSGQIFKVTLAWIDPNGTVGTGKTLVNDLDLEVTSPNGDLYYGNIGYVENGSTPVDLDDVHDSLNNLEQVIIKSPVAGTYKVKVVATNVPGNGVNYPINSYEQGYAVIATGNLGEGADISYPRLSAKFKEISGGCDNDNSLDPNESITVTLDLVNSGEANSGKLTAIVSTEESQTGIDASNFTIPDDGIVELDPIMARSQTAFDVKIGLGNYEGDLCDKRAAFRVTIKNEADEVIEETVFSIVMGVDYGLDNTTVCQTEICNPPVNITSIEPSSVRPGDYGINLTLNGENFRDELQVRFDPDVITYDEVYRRSPSKILVKNIRISEEADPGEVVIYANNIEEPERTFAGLLSVVEGQIEDGDADMEIDTENDSDQENAIDKDDDSGCSSTNNHFSVAVLMLLAIMFFRSRRKVWTEKK